MNLHQAARKGDLEAIRAARAAGQDLGAKDKKGRTPLAIAAKESQADAVELLLELGADPALADADGHTALDYALDGIEDPRVFCRFIERGCDPNAQGVTTGNTPLNRAVYKQDAASTLWLIRHGADVNLLSGGFPPLLTALMAGMSRVWKSGVGYVKEKPDPEERLRECADEARQFLSGPSGEPAEIDPEAPPKHAVVRILLKAGADPNSASDDGFTPLILAAQSGDRPMVQELLRAGAEVNRAFQGETALYRAAEMLRPEIVRDLLEAGADPNIAGEDGGTPLMQVIHNWPRAVEDQDEVERQAAQFFGGEEESRRTVCPQVCQWLLQFGADVNARNGAGETALVHAVQNGSTAAVEMLLAAGADPAVEDDDGKTALDHVEDRTPGRVRELLEKAGSGVKGPSPQKALLDGIAAGDPAAVRAALARKAEANPQKGFPPLLAAVGAGNAEVVRLLVEAGAEVNPVPREDVAVQPALVAAAEAGHAEVVRVLIEAGADLNALNQGRDAVITAAFHRHWDVVDVLLATAFMHPDLEPFLATRTFPATSREPAFRAWSDRLAQRLGCEAAEVEGMPGVFWFSVPKAGEREKGPGAFSAGFEEDRRRKEQHRAVVAERGDAVQADGYHLVVADAAVGMDTAVFLVPSPNQYAILAAMGTNGMNYQLSTSDVIRWLREMESEVPLRIDGVGHDKVEGRFLQPIPDPKSLAKRMYKFCPDIVDQGCGTVARLAKELVKTQRFFFWWD